MASEAPFIFLFLEIFSQEGGIQSFIRDILQSYLELPAQPHATVFLLRDRPPLPPQFQSERITFRCFTVQHPTLRRLHLAIALWVELLRHRPQRVFCGHINLAPLVYLLCRPLGIPYTVITYGKDVWESLPLLPRFALQQADHLWTISRYTRDRACAANQLDPARMQLLYCAVDGDRFTPGPKSPALLSQYGLSQTSIVLLTVARLWSGDPYKGVEVTIRALPTILATFPQVRYLVIGRGDDQPRLATLATELGVLDHVIFAGFVPTEALPEHYRLADAYIMPSQEGFGIVYLEAMACGIPVIAGDADGSAEPLREGELGWRVPCRDPQAVAQAAIELLQELDDHPQPDVLHPRTNPYWLRQQTLAYFSQSALTQRLQQLLGSTPPH